MAFTGNLVCDSFKEALLTGDISLSNDAIYIALYTNEASLTKDTTEYTSENEVSASGYTAGGQQLTTSVTTANNVSYVDFGNVTWNSAITARGALIYQGNGTAICVLDFGIDRTSTSQFTVEFPEYSSDSAIIRLS